MENLKIIELRAKREKLYDADKHVNEINTPILSRRYFSGSISRVVSLITRPRSFDLHEPRWPRKHTKCDQTIVLVDDLVSAEGGLEGRFLISYLSNKRMNGIPSAFP